MTERIVEQPTNASEEKTLIQEVESITFNEFMARYEGQPYEWHAGKVVLKVSNNERHALIFNFLHILLSMYISLKHLGRVYPDGYSMYISDDLPARQPDLMVVFTEHLDRAKHNRLEGPADIAIEIVSPASSAVDRGEKLSEYEQAGVREYWLIDPLREEAVVYSLHDDGHYRRLPLGDDNALVSNLLPEFSFDSQLLWREELPTGQELLELLQAITI